MIEQGMKHVFFFGKGRLGNQVIQAAALRKLFPSAKLRLFNALSLRSLIAPVDGVVISDVSRASWMAKRQLGLVRAFLRFLALRLRLFSYIKEKAEYFGGRHHESGEPIFQRGLLSFVYAEKLYLQNFNSLLSPQDFTWLSLSSETSKRVSEIFSAHAIEPARSLLIHVRRGDYAGFTFYGLDNIILSADYYEQAVAEARHRYGPLPAVIVTDDIPWCADNLNFAEDACFLAGSELEDFACLASAHYLVCANSTFSLSAAMMSKVLISACLPARWLGYNHDVWLPPGIRTADQRFVYVGE